MNIYQICLHSIDRDCAAMARSLSERADNRYSIRSAIPDDAMMIKAFDESGDTICAIDIKKDRKEIIEHILQDIREHQPDIVLVLEPQFLKIASAIRSEFRKKIPVVYLFYCPGNYFPMFSKLFLNLSVNVFIGSTQGITEGLIKGGVFRKKAHVIMPGIPMFGDANAKRVQQIKDEFALHDYFVIGTALPFLPEEKGYDTFFHAFSELEGRYKILLIGIQPDEVADVYAFSEQYGIARNRIAITENEKDIKSAYYATDIMVFPSKVEGLPLTLLEASAAKRPIIASNISGFNEFISHEDNGLLFRCDDEKDLREKIIRLRNEPATCEKVSENAYQRVVENFSFDTYKTRLFNVLDGLLHKNVAGESEQVQ